MTPWFHYEPNYVDLTILYVSLCFGIGGLIHCILKNVKIGDVRIPYAAILIIIGVLLGFISLTSEILRIIAAFITNFSAFDLIALVFPSFTFKMAFQMDVHIFLKSFTQILTISVFGFAISCVILGFFMAYSAGKGFTITTAIIFGLLASVTDTEDTNKFLGQFKNLGVLLAGEEFMTTSLSLFLYETVIHFDGVPLTVDPVATVLFKMTGAIFMGLIVGKLFISLVRWDRCDFATIVTVSLFIAYALFYGVRIYLGASGILTLTVFGIIICSNKGKITAELERSLVQFWDLLYTLFNFLLYIQAGVILAVASYSHGEGNDIVTILMTYIVCLITRAVMLVILSPLLSRIGYGLNWKNSVVLVWGALKGTSTILLAFCFYSNPSQMGELSSKIVIYAVGLVFLHLVINGTTVKKLVRLLGFTTVSMMKISNMNVIIRYVMSARDRSINVLKMNKLYADAAWDTVRDATKIIHPYKASLPQEGEFKEGEEIGFNYSTCPDCKKEVPLEPTAKELQEMKKEAYLRILKAKKVSYWRQFEWGMMSKDAHRTLVSTVNDALEKKTGVMDADSLKTLWKPRGFTVFVRNKMVKLIPKKDLTVRLKSPLRSWQIPLYKIVSSLWWEYSLFLLIILIIISFTLDLIYRPKFNGIHEMVLVAISTVCFVLLILLTFLKMTAVGCYNYMRSAWHLIDTLTVVLTFFYIFYVYKYYFRHDDKSTTHLILLCLSGSRMIYTIRFFRLCFVVQTTIPKLVELLDRKIDVHLAHGYDVGKGFVTGEDEVLKLLPRFVGDPKVFAEIKVKLEANRLAMTKEIGILQRNRPTIAITVKTREAMASVLHVMKATTKDLKDGGLLDDEEYLLMSRAIDERQKYIRKRFLSIAPCSPDVLLRQVSWLIDDEDTATFLITHSLTVNLNFEEILIRADDEPQGIYVIVSGMARINYMPNPKKLEKLEKLGALPNVDYPNGMDYREQQEDYIVSGNVVGEIGILTRRAHDASITCESSVQAYFISIDVMNYAIKSQAGNYNGLQQRIWKAVSVRLACIILPAVPTYQSWTQEKIQRYLERSFVPKLNKSRTFIFGDVIEAVLLIEGRALDVINKDVYFAPSYIPRTVQKLNFGSNPASSGYHTEPILLVVPAEDIDEQDLMDYLEGDNELRSTRSAVGLQRKLHRVSQIKPEGRKRNKLGLSTMDTYRGGVRAIRAGSAAFEKFQRGLDNSDADWNQHDIKTAEEEEMPYEESGKRRDSAWYEKDEREDSPEGGREAVEALNLDDEKSDDKTEAGLYSFSYFNYKPLYDIDSEDEDDYLLSPAAVRENVRSRFDEQNKDQVKMRRWKVFHKNDGSKSVGKGNEPTSDDDKHDTSNPKAGTSKLS